MYAPSWLDQAEIYFSVVQRTVVVPNDFNDTDQIRDRLDGVGDRYNAVHQAFNWRFTRSDLDDLLQRITAHEQADHHALAA